MAEITVARAPSMPASASRRLPYPDSVCRLPICLRQRVLPGPDCMAAGEYFRFAFICLIFEKQT
jgi:hypothetical protein